MTYKEAVKKFRLKMLITQEEFAKLLDVSFATINRFESVSLDVTENIVSLCSNCHNEIHYGKTISNAHFLWYNCKQIKVAKMALSYNGLWKLLIDKGLNKGYLHKLTGLSRSTLTKLVKGENVNTDVLERICIALECQLDDIVEMKKEEI